MYTKVFSSVKARRWDCIEVIQYNPTAVFFALKIAYCYWSYLLGCNWLNRVNRAGNFAAFLH